MKLLYLAPPILVSATVYGDDKGGGYNENNEPDSYGPSSMPLPAYEESKYQGKGYLRHSHDKPWELVGGIMCDQPCMGKSRTCRYLCNVNSVDGSVKCEWGHLPIVCDKCCQDIEDSPICPIKKVCASKCVAETFQSIFKVCLLEKMKLITASCEEECKEMSKCK